MTIYDKKKLFKLCTLFLFWIISVSISAQEVITVLLDAQFPIFQKIVENFEADARQNNFKTNRILIDKSKTFASVVSLVESLNTKYIFTIGRQSSIFGKELNLPGIFSMVLFPEKEGLMDEQGTPLLQLTGIKFTCDFIPQLKIIREILPKMKRVGMVYSPVNSKQQVKEIINQLPPEISIIEAMVEKNDEIVEAFDNIKKKSDIFFAVVDYTVYNPRVLKYITMCSIMNRVPLIGFSKGLTQSGALISFYPDYEDIGRQALQIILSIQKGTPVKSIKVAFPKKMVYSINANTAKVLNISIPNSILKNSEK